VLEKAREAGQHCLSGALLDPRSMKELLPGFENEARSTPSPPGRRVFPDREKHFKFPPYARATAGSR